MATEYKLSYTASDINERLRKVNDIDSLKALVGNTSVSDQISDAIENLEIDTYEHPATHPASMITGLANIATSGDYNDLTNKPTIPTQYTHPTSHPASMITGLATVATSGSYNDLSNKPTIPSIVGLATTDYVEDKIAEAMVEVYVQDEEPADAVTGSIWVDTNEEGMPAPSAKTSANVYVVDARTEDLTTVDFSGFAIGDVVVVTIS